MKVKFYLLSWQLLLFITSWAQDCSSLSLTYTTTESRCVSTGSITLNVTGGSGNYNYKATGTVTTPTTSSNIINGLPRGWYSVLVKDLTSGCSIQSDSIFVEGSYSDPRFQLSKADATCANNDGIVFVIKEQFGRSPFTYTIIAPSPSNIGITNTSGNFSGLIPGEYVIQLQDSCGGIQVRRITIENYNWWVDSLSVARLGCDSAQVLIRLADNKGNGNMVGTTFNGFAYGVVLNAADTTWYLSNSFHTFLGKRRSLIIVVKDNCGNIHAVDWNLPASLRPSLNSVSVNPQDCSSFDASVTGQNLVNPDFCLYDFSNVLLSCNTSGIFNGLDYGSYCIRVTDACYDTTISRCFTATQPVPYIDASVTITNLSCSTFTCAVTGQRNILNPNYCLVDTNDVVISCNASGVFTTVPYGNYCIMVQDMCTGAFLKRCFSISKPKPVLASYSITGSTCSSLNVSVTGNYLNNALFCLYNSAGQVISCDSSGNFNGINQGSYCIRAITCTDTSNSICFVTSRPIPSISAGVQILNKNCTTFSASVTGQTNLTNPQYCLYDQNDTLIRCNATGIFDSLLYGSYCIKVKNTCYDTTFSRCFTQLKDLPFFNGSLQLVNSTCSTVSFQASVSNLISPQFCLYGFSNNIIECNTSGLFSNMPYGNYCVAVNDVCADTTIRMCQTFQPVTGLTLYTSKSCSINKTNIDVVFASGSGPYSIQVFHPNGTMTYSTITTLASLRIPLPSLPLGTRYKIRGTDACGNIDSATIAPDANLVSHQIDVRSKCPSATWLNGAGDLAVTLVSNYFPVTPQIIKKDGSVFLKGYSSLTGNQYIFSDLEPAQYIVQYTQSSCNGQWYDTVMVNPYAYPSQGQSAIYQCDNNSFSLGAAVQGGVSPYSFQIIGSLPEQPSIISSPQPSGVFNINTGTVYSLVRLRSIDACGNATLNDVSILPLQNLSVTASNTCFYQNVMLAVDGVPNATYTWFKKTSPTDSVLIGTGLNFNLPFFVPEQIGEYVCKIVVNDGCITRRSSFNLNGDCGELLLPVAFHINGRTNHHVNQLFWTNPDETHLLRYEVERKQPHDTHYRWMRTLVVKGSGGWVINDETPAAGSNLYRLKLIYQDGYAYTNVVTLKNESGPMVVFPNPVHQEFHITFSSRQPSNYMMELIAANGQILLKKQIRSISASTITYSRNQLWKSGMYVIRITEMETGTTVVHKLLFE